MSQFVSIYNDISEQFGAVSSTADAKGLLGTIVNAYELETAAFLSVRPVHEEPGPPFYVSTYSEEWVGQYVKMNYLAIDPVLSHGLRSVSPFDWATLDLSDRAVGSFFGEAREFGVGKHGLSIPIRGHDGERAILSVTSNAKQARWDGFLRSQARDFQLLAAEIYDSIARMQGRPRFQVSCTGREIECLKWIANGRTIAQAAHKMGLSPRTVRFHLDLTRAKLGAHSLPHAVAIAFERGLFF